VTQQLSMHDPEVICMPLIGLSIIS
jgi:hypothetical protein